MTPRLALLLSTCVLACAGLRSRPAAPDAPRPLHVARMNGRWGFLDDDARIALAPEWDEAWPFVDGRARVRRGTDWFLIDERGARREEATAPAVPAEAPPEAPCPTGLEATPAGVDDVPCTAEEAAADDGPLVDLRDLRELSRTLQRRWDGAPGFDREASVIRTDVLALGQDLAFLDDAGFALPLPPPLRAMEAHFEVVEVLEPRAGAAVARIRGGTNEGLALGTTGTAWKHPAQDPAEAIGFARVLEVGPGTALVLVKSLRDNLVPPIAPEVAAGQTVALPMKVPERAFRGVVLDLLALGIVFTDGVDPFLTLPHAMRSQSPRLEMQVLEDARRAIAETAERERPGATNPAWLSPQESGRFAGKGLLDAMSSATVEDVRAFFEFVRAYPGKYIGRQWRIDETFATWVVNGTPGAQ